MQVVCVVLFWAALIDVIRRISKTYPTLRDVAWAGADGVALALAAAVLSEAGVGKALVWAASCGAWFAMGVFTQRNPQMEGTPEPPVTSELGNKIAFLGGVILVGALLFAAIALDGWPAASFLAVAVVLVVRLKVSSKKEPARPATEAVTDQR